MAKKANGFRLDGKAFAASSRIPVIVLKVRQLVSTLPDGDLLTTPELLRKAGYTLQTFYSNGRCTHAGLEGFRQCIRYPKRTVVWGNKKTIAKLRKCKEILA